MMTNDAGFVRGSLLALLLASAMGQVSCSRDADEHAAEAVVEAPVDADAEAAVDLRQVRSPNGRLSFATRLGPNGGLQYKVDLDDQPILAWSDLGVSVSSTARLKKTIADFRSTIEVVDEQRAPFSGAYEMVTGKRKANAYSGNELALTVRDIETDRRLRLDVRMFDQAFAFRYVLLDDDPLPVRAQAESTSFNVGADARFWGQPYDIITHAAPAYETQFTNGVAAGLSVADEVGTGWGFPSLFQTAAGNWLLLHETDVGKDDHGTHLQPEAPDGHYRVAFPLADTLEGLGENTPVWSSPWEMPWRFGVVSDDIGDIVESNTVFHLSRASQIANTSWVEPGVASWSWWSDHGSSRNQTALQSFIDLAAEIGLDYALIDANWNTISSTAMQDLVSYANARNVGLFFWYNSGGPYNSVPEQPRNIMSEVRRRREEFAMLQSLGVRGVKVDFFGSDKQVLIQHYLEILEDAADFEIMVNFHGSTIPRGWERTWPNLVTMEAVRGAENYTSSNPKHLSFSSEAPALNTILPFTRNVIGSMDYTPVTYTESYQARHTTFAHETALAVVFESGVQHLADSAESLQALPADYKAFFAELPAAWDETVFVSGFPGRDVVLARRKGARWYVAGLNGEGVSKTLTLDLSFVSNDAFTLLHDEGNGEVHASSIVAPDDLATVTIDLQAYGGFTLIAR